MDRVLPTAARSSCRRTETTRLAVDCGAGGLLARSLDEEAESVIRQWRIDHEGVGLNPFCTMRDPLGRTFGYDGSPGIRTCTGILRPTCASRVIRRERPPDASAG